MAPKLDCAISSELISVDNPKQSKGRLRAAFCMLTIDSYRIHRCGAHAKPKVMVRADRVVIPRAIGIHDARVAALCLQHGVRELWSADRDFGRFPSLTTTNPMVG